MTPVSAFCPNCGAPVTFRWSSSIQTTCAQCWSILVRSDVNLAKVGVVSDLPPENSPIQIGTQGVYEKRGFTVAGRIIYDYEGGHWNEWHIVMSDGSSAWLSDAQADYAVTFPVTSEGLPPVKSLQVGSPFHWNRSEFQVTTITVARYRGVEGELPFQYWDKHQCPFVDLRSATADFATLDYSDDPPTLYIGRAVEFDSLQLKYLRDLDPATSTGGAMVKPTATAQSLSCPNCGGAVVVRAMGHSITVVCQHCSSVLDARSPQLRILQRFHAAMKQTPLIPLGSRGKWRGTEYEVIGYQQRDTTIEGESYDWREYVLFNPYKGFRYFTESGGHWNDAKAISSLPEAQGRGVKYLGRNYKPFEDCVARTEFVIGEFPWQVAVGDSCHVTDYVSPPYVLSSEAANHETTWSLGEYVAGADIWRAFALEGSPPEPQGIFENQPDKWGVSARQVWLKFAILAGVCLAILIWNEFTARRAEVLHGEYSFKQGAPGEASFVTRDFQLEGRPSPVEVKTWAQLSNQWIYLNYSLINESTGQAYDFGREVSYYSGFDSDGAWSEGSNTDSVTLPSVPAGRYYLRIEPESDPGVGEIPYSVTVIRGVTVAGLYWAAFALLLIPALVLSYRAHRFEQERWAASSPPFAGRRG